MLDKIYIQTSIKQIEGLSDRDHLTEDQVNYLTDFLWQIANRCSRLLMEFSLNEETLEKLRKLRRFIWVDVHLIKSFRSFKGTRWKEIIEIISENIDLFSEKENQKVVNKIEIS